MRFGWISFSISGLSCVSFRYGLSQNGEFIDRSDFWPIYNVSTSLTLVLLYIKLATSMICIRWWWYTDACITCSAHNQWITRLTGILLQRSSVKFFFPISHMSTIWHWWRVEMPIGVLDGCTKKSFWSEKTMRIIFWFVSSLAWAADLICLFSQRTVNAGDDQHHTGIPLPGLSPYYHISPFSSCAASGEGRTCICLYPIDFNPQMIPTLMKRMTRLSTRSCVCGLCAQQRRP